MDQSEESGIDLPEIQETELHMGNKRGKLEASTSG